MKWYLKYFFYYYYYQKLPNTNLLSAFRGLLNLNAENWLQKNSGLFSCSMYVTSNIHNFCGVKMLNHQVMWLSLTLKILPPSLVNSIIFFNSNKSFAILEHPVQCKVLNKCQWQPDIRKFISENNITFFLKEESPS